MLCLWLSEVFVVGRNYTYIYTQAPVVQNGELKHNQARLITGTLWSFVAGTTEQVDATAWISRLKTTMYWCLVEKIRALSLPAGRW